MESKLNVVKFKDFITLKRGYDLPTRKRKTGNVPVLSSSGISGNHNEYKVDGPGVITGRSGLIGSVYYIRKEFWPLNTTLYVTDFKGNNPLYVYYKLKTINLKNFATGSSVPTLNRNHLDSIDVNIHDKEKQKKQIFILEKIDKKINLNRQIIANLEELSQTLFKRWFVDFEFPDENDNPYKSSGGEMIDSELGEIPSGWQVGVLSDMTEIIMGQSPKSDTYNNNKVGLPLLNGASDFKNRNIQPTKYTSDSKKIGHNLDYVFGVRATIGLVTELDNDYAIGRGVGLSKNNKENREFIYEILNRAFTYFERIGSGSVYINISSKDLKQYKLIIPSKQVLIKYHNHLEPIFSELRNLKKQITSLTNLRDTLLPKLMSGEIEIPDNIEVNADEISI
ncbi:TPA: restriction endonuclease subunit S [Staphylococcus aureus]|nr:restriction endonuclease subunit S [Staphylococcus aureus]